jgi:excinuclease ABC subunit A
MAVHVSTKRKNTKKFTDFIRVRGAREHNLKDVDVDIPKNTLTVITGPSGSGKSSLAMDILFTEGKRRYMESLSSYARQFLGISRKPEFDTIEGLCPAIAIEQKTVSSNPRSTVGTITEIYDYLRVLFARIGNVHCGECHMRIEAQSPESITAMIVDTFGNKLVTIAAPIAIERKGEFVHELEKLFQQGFYRFIVDGQTHRFKMLTEIHALKLKKTFKHSIDLLIDAIEIHGVERTRLQEAIETSFKLAHGVVKIMVGDTHYLYSSNKVCLQCAVSVPEIEPRLFSFNSPIGACPACGGLGVIHQWPWSERDAEHWKSDHPDFFGNYATEQVCEECHGKRLNKQALAVTIGGLTIFDLGNRSIKQLDDFFVALTLNEQGHLIGNGIIKEVRARLSFLQNVGLSYLTLNRQAGTLSGGEGQRIRLATQIGSALSGVLYILDEPSIGLHQRDNDRLIATLHNLRDQGNTIVVVEHDIDTMRASDYIIDMGPAAGVLGGRITAVGTPYEIAHNPQSLTGGYLSGKHGIERLVPERTPQGYLTLQHATKHNLKDVTVSFPLGVICGLSGVSGSGKSTLIMQVLVPMLASALQYRGRKAVSSFANLEGIDKVDSMVVIDQSPIGRTPRSNPATYLGVFDAIRQLFVSLPESKARGYKVGRFSFNVPEGRCFECRGDGIIKVTMHFLPEVIMVCGVCKGQRYDAQTLQITFKDKNIAQVLDMTALEAAEFFAAHTQIAKRLRLLCDVGLDYVKLGQSSTTLSGGEAQRIKLVDELAKRGKNTLYILDEPTTGLHNSDIERLLVVLNTLVDKGNSMIIIEHNLDVLKTVDYIIDLGPEGGDEGGAIVAQGTPQEVANSPVSYTGQYLKRVLSSAK